MLRPKLAPSIVVGVLCALSAACSGPDPAPDLTGTWEERDPQGVLQSQWAFAANGQFAYDHLPVPTIEDAEHLGGAYRVVNGSELLLDGVDVGARQRLRSQITFYTRGELLAPEAFLAVSPRADLLGLWRQRAERQTQDLGGQQVWQERRTQTLELRPDGQLRLAQTVDDQPAGEDPGRYEALGAGLYQFTLELVQVRIRFSLQLVNGEALAPRVYRRVLGSAAPP